MFACTQISWIYFEGLNKNIKQTRYVYNAISSSFLKITMTEAFHHKNISTNASKSEIYESKKFHVILTTAKCIASFQREALISKDEVRRRSLRGCSLVVSFL